MYYSRIVLVFVLYLYYTRIGGRTGTVYEYIYLKTRIISHTSICNTYGNNTEYTNYKYQQFSINKNICFDHIHCIGNLNMFSYNTYLKPIIQNLQWNIRRSMNVLVQWNILSYVLYKILACFFTLFVGTSYRSFVTLICSTWLSSRQNVAPRVSQLHSSMYSYKSRKKIKKSKGFYKNLLHSLF